MPDKSVKRDRASYLGVPETYELNMSCWILRAAFPTGGTYQVGSSLEKRDYRDVDVRTIIPDEDFIHLFGEDSIPPHHLNPLWSLMCTSISHWLRLRTGLPIDYQIQPRNWANEKYPNQVRNALGITFDIMRREHEGQ